MVYHLQSEGVAVELGVSSKPPFYTLAVLESTMKKGTCPLYCSVHTNCKKGSCQTS